MIDAADALDALHDWKRARGPFLSTGLPVLDQCTDGFNFGQVWVIVSRPGHGRSTLALNFAVTLAGDSGVATDFHSVRDSLDLVSSRFLALVSKVQTHRLRNGDIEGSEITRLDAAISRLHDVPLRFSVSSEIFTPSRSPRRSKAYVIDDLHRSHFHDARTLKEQAERGNLIIVTVPRHLVLTGEGIDPTWADVADVIIDVNRPDAEGCGESANPGEAELRVVRNRLGPQAILSVIFQGIYARFSPKADNPG